ncbi:hypothetical protein GA0074696_4018 [Micromonospora purpureochromogenes]|uniref:Extracellular repeat, HAF family n=1 Tax=Micromonospora purpureochromogenes TaxID=47872 RepID=A0A1C4Z4C5_9ACTN|nr:hypothetical protein [Micromonospora purpureochromogenes]SCF27756.1 hypothetical protein GA0074696_4018 [Micromonospora purpureochromogenes]
MTHLARRRMLAAATAGLLSAALGVATAPATAAPRTATASACKLTTLTYPAGVYRAEANAVDPTGRFIAGKALRVREEGNQNFLLVWDRRRLTTIESSLAENVADVNTAGTVVGSGWADGRLRPWVLRDGAVAPLPTPPGGAGATAINTTGDVVGSGVDPDTGDPFPVRWPAARPGTFEVLDLPAFAEPAGITEDGTIVGTAGEFAAWTGWVRYPDGRVEALTVPGALTTIVFAAQGHWAIGRVNLGDGNQVKVRWDLRDGSWSRLADELPLLTDVNSRGTVVGGDRIARGDTSRLLPGGGAQVGVGARAIADTGTVVGFRNDDGRLTPVRWTGC